MNLRESITGVLSDKRFKKLYAIRVCHREGESIELLENFPINRRILNNLLKVSHPNMNKNVEELNWLTCKDKGYEVQIILGAEIAPLYDVSWKKEEYDDGNQFKKMRIKAGLSRKEVCEELEIPYRTLQDWERGVFRPTEYIVKLLTFYFEHRDKE